MNAEYVEALLHLEDQLVRAGVRASTTRTALAAYAAALVHRGELYWRMFYRTIHAALCELAEGPLTFPDGAARPLLALLDDDLGSRLVDSVQRARIRDRLVEYGTREASLSS